MKTTLARLRALRDAGEKAVCVTAYDYPTATFADRAGVDLILVGDSAAMTLLGHRTTTSVGMRTMLTLAAAVCRAVKPCGSAFVVGDLPFLSYQQSDRDAVINAGRFAAVGCDAVKCEGGRRIAPRVRAMVNAGVNVMGHIGLTPQSLAQLSGYRVQGRNLDGCRQLADDAAALRDAGAFAILLEAVPPEAALYVRERVDIILYGIGAGPHVDGQLVISNDILGNFVGDIRPRFVRRYASLGATAEAAFTQYGRDVRGGSFPAPEHWYKADPDVPGGVVDPRELRKRGRAGAPSGEHGEEVFNG